MQAKLNMLKYKSSSHEGDNAIIKDKLYSGKFNVEYLKFLSSDILNFFEFVL